MADIKKTVEIIFNAGGDLGNGLQTFSSDISQFESSVGTVTGPLAGLTDSLFKTEAAILAVAAAYGGFAISKAIEFQTAQTDLAKVLGDTDPAIDSFTEGVIELSEEYGIASTTILQGIANFKQAGFTASESALLQKQALDLVIAGDIEAALASDLLVASLKGFGFEASETSRFIESLNNVSNNYATDLEQLAIGMSRVSPIASQLGFSFDETAGILTPVIEVFRSGAEAANALRTGLLKLTDDSKPVQDALKQIGVNQFDSNGIMRDGRAIFFDVAEAFRTLDQNQKLVVTSQLVGIEQAGRMITVFDNLEKVNQITATAMERTGSVTQEVSLRLANAGKQAEIAFQSFNNLAIAVGEKLLPGFGDVTAGSNTLLQAFKNIVNAGGLEPLFTAMAEQSEDIGIFLEDIAAALPEAFAGLDFTNLLASFQNIRDSIGGLFDDLDLTDPEQLNLALQKLLDFLALLSNASAGAIQGLEPLIDGFVSLLETLAESDGDSQTFIGNIGGIATTIDKVLPALSFFADALGIVGGALGIIAGTKAIGSFGALGSAMGLLNPVSATLAAAVGAITFAIGANVTAAEELGAANKQLGIDSQNTADNLGKAQSRLREISVITGVTVTSIQELDEALATGNILFDEATGKYSSAASGIRNYDKEVVDAVGDTDSWADSIAGVTGVLRDMGIAVDGSVLGITDLGTEQEKLNALIAEADSQGLSYRAGLKDGVATIETWGDANKEAEQTLAKVTEEVDKLTDREKLLITNSLEVEKTLLQLASNEKIKAMEFTAQINVAQIEADAQRVEAAFLAASDIIASFTNESVGILGLLGDESISAFDKLAITDAIKQNQKRQDKALDNATKLNDAQVEYMRARTEALIKGEAKIVINADGLQPALEEVLRSLVEFIQIEANEEGLELLL